MAQSVFLGRRLLIKVHKFCSAPTRPHMSVSKRCLSAAVPAQNRIRLRTEPRFSFRGPNIFDSKSFSGARAFSSSSGDSFDDPVELWLKLPPLVEVTEVSFEPELNKLGSRLEPKDWFRQRTHSCIDPLNKLSVIWKPSLIFKLRVPVGTLNLINSKLHSLFWTFYL